MRKSAFRDDLPALLPRKDACYTCSAVLGDIYVGTSDGCVLAFNSEAGTTREISLTSRPIKGICGSSDAGIFAYDSSCIYELPISGGEKRVVQSPANIESVTLASGSSGSLCVGTAAGVFLTRTDGKSGKLAKPVLQVHVLAMADCGGVIVVLSGDYSLSAYLPSFSAPLEIRCSDSVVSEFLRVDTLADGGNLKSCAPFFRCLGERVYLSVANAILLFKILPEAKGLAYERYYVIQNGVEIMDISFLERDVAVLCRSAAPASSISSAPRRETLLLLSETLDTARYTIDLSVAHADGASVDRFPSYASARDSHQAVDQIIGIHGYNKAMRCKSAFTQYRPVQSYLFLTTRFGFSCLYWADETDRILMRLSEIQTSATPEASVRELLRDSCDPSNAVPRATLETEILPALLNIALYFHNTSLALEVLESPQLNPTALGAGLITSLVLEFLAAGRVGEAIKYIPGYGEDNTLSSEVYNIVLGWAVETDPDLALTLARRWNGCYSYQLLNNSAMEHMIRSPESAKGLQRLVLFCSLKLGNLSQVYRLSLELNGPEIAFRVARKYGLHALAYADLDRLVTAEMSEPAVIELADFGVSSLLSRDPRLAAPNEQLLEFLKREAELIKSSQLAASDAVVGELFIQHIVIKCLALAVNADSGISPQAVEACLACADVAVATAITRQRVELATDLIIGCARLFLSTQDAWSTAVRGFILETAEPAYISSTTARLLAKAYSGLHANSESSFGGSATFLSMFLAKDVQAALRSLALETGRLLYAKLLVILLIYQKSMDIVEVVTIYKEILGITTDQPSRGGLLKGFEADSPRETPLTPRTMHVESHKRTRFVEACRALIKVVFDTISIFFAAADVFGTPVADKKQPWLTATSLILPVCREWGVGYECVDTLLWAAGGGVGLEEALERLGGGETGDPDVLLGVRGALGLSSDILERALELGRGSAELAFQRRWKRLRRGVLVPAAPRCAGCGREIREEQEGLPAVGPGGSVWHRGCAPGEGYAG